MTASQNLGQSQMILSVDSRWLKTEQRAGRDGTDEATAYPLDAPSMH